MLQHLLRVSPFLFLLGGQGRFEFTEVHMGMPVRIVLYADTDSAARAAARAAFRRIAELDNTFSDYRPQSEVRRMEARAGEWVAVSAELFALTARALEIARLSDGAFDPTAAPIVGLWREARRTKVLPSRARIDSTRALTGWRRIGIDSGRRAIRLDPGMRLDFGGIAKGYILDQARQSLGASGVDRVLIEAGGDIVVGSAPPGAAGWVIDAPGASPEFVRRISALTNAAVSTSGPSVQFVEIQGVRYSHVVDPRTGMALTNGRAVRVLATDGGLADALATGLSVAAFPVADVVVDIVETLPVSRAPREKER